MDSSWEEGLFHAGATQAGYVAKVVGLHPEVYFKYRVKSPQECEAILRSLTGADPIPIMEKLVAESIAEWSFKAPTTSQLRHPLLKRVFWIIVQNEATDPIPNQFENQGTLEDQVKK